jgi:hypothetical protein
MGIFEEIPDDLKGGVHQHPKISLCRKRTWQKAGQDIPKKFPESPALTRESLSEARWYITQKTLHSHSVTPQPKICARTWRNGELSERGEMVELTYFSTPEVEVKPDSLLSRLASLASRAPTRASPRATLGFKTVSCETKTEDLKRRSIRLLNQRKIE